MPRGVCPSFTSTWPSFSRFSFAFPGLFPCFSLTVSPLFLICFLKNSLHPLLSLCFVLDSYSWNAFHFKNFTSFCSFLFGLILFFCIHNFLHFFCIVYSYIFPTFRQLLAKNLYILYVFVCVWRSVAFYSWLSRPKAYFVFILYAPNLLCTFFALFFKFCVLLRAICNEIA